MNTGIDPLEAVPPIGLKEGWKLWAASAISLWSKLPGLCGNCPTDADVAYWLQGDI
ncbi:MAG: hypothetical protein O6950_00820 [Gammaproteobacteria bacterium]|nr:hypothetical protein [Gammaproteobacteria bacterium]